MARPADDVDIAALTTLVECPCVDTVFDLCKNMI